MGSDQLYKRRSLSTDDGASRNDAMKSKKIRIALGGRYSRDLFNKHGDLRHIRRLRFWPLKKVLVEKYEFSEQDAKDLSDFLVPEKRPTAIQCLLHPWINAGSRQLELSLPDAQSKAVDALDSEQTKKQNEEE
ncbi:hypothetical protein H5410_060099 [Solanum commersonii]|uniref:non-specific serine/threonine protein kinase n=1 Tax=Solanum commersonii TaxID=4109 RepID=A0A9J5W466_SOLCO|nr:hypothetical protein H5410_060099 [Solanum commersonii]